MPEETASTLKEYTGRTANRNHIEITETDITKTETDTDTQITIPKENSTIETSSTIYFDPLPGIFILLFVGMSFAISMVITFAYNSLLIQLGTFAITVIITLLLLQPRKAPAITVKENGTAKEISFTLSQKQYETITSQS